MARLAGKVITNSTNTVNAAGGAGAGVEAPLLAGPTSASSSVTTTASAPAVAPMSTHVVSEDGREIRHFEPKVGLNIAITFTNTVAFNIT
jgi:hypothetical protein